MKKLVFTSNLFFLASCSDMPIEGEMSTEDAREIGEMQELSGEYSVEEQALEQTVVVESFNLTVDDFVVKETNDHAYIQLPNDAPANLRKYIEEHFEVYVEVPVWSFDRPLLKDAYDFNDQEAIVLSPNSDYEIHLRSKDDGYTTFPIDLTFYAHTEAEAPVIETIKRVEGGVQTFYDIYLKTANPDYTDYAIWIETPTESGWLDPLTGNLQAEIIDMKTHAQPVVGMSTSHMLIIKAPNESDMTFVFHAFDEITQKSVASAPFAFDAAIHSKTVAESFDIQPANPEAGPTTIEGVDTMTVSEIDAQIASLRTEIQSLRAQRKELKDQKKAVKAQIREKKNERRKVNLEFKQAKLEALKDWRTLRDQVREQRRQMNDDDDDNESTSSLRLKDLRDARKAKANEIAILKAERKKKLAAIDEAMAPLKEQIKSIKVQTKQLTTSMKALRLEIRELKRSV